MKVHLNLSYFQPLVILAGLMVCASSMANDIEATTNTQQNAKNSVTSSTTSINSQEVKKALKNPSSMLVEMAFKFKNSEGSVRDYAEVAANYCRAARSGDADAQYALGWMYANGKGVTADESIAAQLFSMAAEQKHARAIESLATISGTALQSNLPSCLLPDPPAKITITTNEEVSKKTISDETAALFYSQSRILKLVDKLAPRYLIDTNLAMAFIAVESGFDSQATSPKNAQGLMQLIPETAERFGVKNVYKAEDNIKGGLAYLQWLLAYFKGDVGLVAAAYNSGERAVDKYKGIPPYAETQMYVKKITSLYNKSTHPYRDDLVKASPIFGAGKKRSI